MQRQHLRWFLCLGSLLGGCTLVNSTAEFSDTTDGGRDAGPLDAGPMDSGPEDAGPPDAGDDGGPDAGNGAGPDGGFECTDSTECGVGVCVDGGCRSRYLKASNPGEDDSFGDAVAVSADGRTIAVGAPGESSCFPDSPADNGCNRAGAVYVFASDEDGVWSQQAYLKSASPDEEDEFGGDVALSADGSVLAVGAFRDDACGTDPSDDGCENAGAVYVFTRDSSSAWSRSAFVRPEVVEAGDGFGATVSLSGSGRTLAVGAPSEDSCAHGRAGTPATDNGCSSSGAVHLFGELDGMWSQTSYVKPDDPFGGDGDFDQFGADVALSQDGNYLVVGAPGESSCLSGVDPAGGPVDDGCLEAGATYVFRFDSGLGLVQEAYLKASNAGEMRFLGQYVAIDADGSRLVVSAVGETSCADGIDPSDGMGSDGCFFSGAAYVFERTGAAWAQLHYLKATNSESDDRFARSLAIDGTGDALAVGAPREDSCGEGVGAAEGNNECMEAGAAWVFDLAPTSSATYVKAPVVDPQDAFGRAVGLSADGALLVSCADEEDGGSAGVDGDPESDSETDSGACFLFYRVDGVWN